MANAKSTEVATVLPGFDATGYMEKSAIEQFDFSNVDQFIATLGLTAEAVAFRASEFDRVDKAELVNVPLFIIEWESKPSQEFGGTYAVVWAIAKQEDGSTRKVVFADGGTGIAAQLEEVTIQREKLGLPVEARTHALMVEAGLVRSDYEAHAAKSGEIDPKTGDVRIIPAGTTYYLG